MHRHAVWGDEQMQRRAQRRRPLSVSIQRFILPQRQQRQRQRRTRAAGELGVECAHGRIRRGQAGQRVSAPTRWASS
ncbi:MAG: hypothetical protein ACLRUN_14500 [Christensenellales bacterium]